MSTQISVLNPLNRTIFSADFTSFSLIGVFKNVKNLLYHYHWYWVIFLKNLQSFLWYSNETLPQQTPIFPWESLEVERNSFRGLGPCANILHLSHMTKRMELEVCFHENKKRYTLEDSIQTDKYSLQSSQKTERLLPLNGTCILLVSVVIKLCFKSNCSFWQKISP